MSQKMLKSMGVKIRRARKQQGKRALDIAVEANIEPSYYSKIENGKARPSLQKIYAICRALGLKTEEILPF